MTQAPSVSIPKRFPLMVQPENRADTTAKDARLVNGYLEKTSDGYRLYKRVGLLTNATFSLGSVATGRGIYNWLNDIYAIFGNKLYKNGVAITGTVDTTNGVYKFSQSLGGTPRLQLTNGVATYNYDSGAGLVQITDPDFPSPIVKGLSYLDRTTYVMTATGSIQGSDLDDPTSWDPLNQIVAQIDPDAGVSMSEQLVYVIAFKQWSTEIFYDAQNPAGSPLGSNQGAKLNWGCVNADSIQKIDGILLWIATNRSSAVQVLMMEKLNAQPISTPAIERLLGRVSFSTVYSWQLLQDGHRFYGITIPAANLTLVYDLDEGLWAQWTDVDGNYFPICASSYTSDLKQLFQHATNGKVYTADSLYKTDDGTAVLVDCITLNFDGGVYRRKTLNKLSIVADQEVGGYLQIRHNDNDYNPLSWSNWRQVDLSQKDPFLTQCGTFIKRAYHLRHSYPTGLRLEALEMQIDIGTL